MTLAFSCACGHLFSTDQWIGWGTAADAPCPRCKRECQSELAER